MPFEIMEVSAEGNLIFIVRLDRPSRIEIYIRAIAIDWSKIATYIRTIFIYIHAITANIRAIGIYIRAIATDSPAIALNWSTIAISIGTTAIYIKEIASDESTIVIQSRRTSESNRQTICKLLLIKPSSEGRCRYRPRLAQRF